jgi:RNA polymerase sigma factor (sigma-70 family)
MDGVSSEDAKDVTQEVLLKVFQNLRSFSKDQEESTFRGWLRRITRNAVIDFWKFAAWRPRRAMGGNEPYQELCRRATDGTASDAEASDPRIAAFADVVAKIRRRCGQQTWAIFTHYVTDGFTAEETSSEFGVSVGYVHQVRARMLHRFRVEFERQCR